MGLKFTSLGFIFFKDLKNIFRVTNYNKLRNSNVLNYYVGLVYFEQIIDVLAKQWLKPDYLKYLDTVTVWSSDVFLYKFLKFLNDLYLFGDVRGLVLIDIFQKLIVILHIELSNVFNLYILYKKLNLKLTNKIFYKGDKYDTENLLKLEVFIEDIYYYLIKLGFVVEKKTFFEKPKLDVLNQTNIRLKYENYKILKNRVEAKKLKEADKLKKKGKAIKLSKKRAKLKVIKFKRNYKSKYNKFKTSSNFKKETKLKSIESNSSSLLVMWENFLLYLRTYLTFRGRRNKNLYKAFLVDIKKHFKNYKNFVILLYNVVPKYVLKTVKKGVVEKKTFKFLTLKQMFKKIMKFMILDLKGKGKTLGIDMSRLNTLSILENLENIQDLELKGLKKNIKKVRDENLESENFQDKYGMLKRDKLISYKNMWDNWQENKVNSKK